jgi:hypothetical protein
MTVEGGATEYFLISLWENIEAVKRFDGPEPGRAVYYPVDEVYFAKDQLPAHVNHYEVKQTGIYRNQRGRHPDA